MKNEEDEDGQTLKKNSKKVPHPFEEFSFKETQHLLTQLLRLFLVQAR